MGMDIPVIFPIIATALRRRKRANNKLGGYFLRRNVCQEAVTIKE